MLQMVVIDLSPQDDPNVIFETLNARGTPLEQSDLIKNFALSGAEDRESDIWANLDDDWWRDEVRQGRLFRPRLDMLLNYWLAMRTGSEVSPSRVFDVFRNYIRDQQIGEAMSQVKRDLANYRRFQAGDRSAEENLFYYRTRVMQVGVITPVLLQLLAVEHGTRIRAFRALESFLVRRMICRQTTKDYNRLVLDLAVRLQTGTSERADRIVTGFLKKQTAYARKWPSDYDVADSMESSSLYRLLIRGRLRLVLEGIEARLRSAKAEQPDVPRSLTIEHLMPQSWKDNWPLPDGVDRVLAEHERNALIHSIGNLTLVTQKLNSALSNAPWKCMNPDDKINCWACANSASNEPKCKCAGLLKHSNLSLNSELTTEFHWDEGSIRARSRYMAKLVSECWPGPDSDQW